MSADTGALEPLKQAAKKTGSSQDGLYEAANDLATAPDEPKATAVIQKFELVQAAYGALSGKTAYKQVIEGKSTLPQDKQQLVKAVTTTYTNLKLIYDQILNLTKLKTQARKINTTDTGTGTLSEAARELNSAAQNLQATPNGGTVQAFKEKYDKFEKAYNDPNNSSAQANVKSDWDALKGAYSHIGSITFPDLLIPNLNNNS